MKNSVESTFDFNIPEETIPVPTKSVTPVDETPVDSVASFVDSEKDPQYYVNRYNNEASYKEWFDKNYPQYDSIYDAVGIDESSLDVTSNDETSVSDTSESKPVTESIIPTCGAGTELRDEICRPIQTPNVSENSSMFENIFGFFRNMFG